jgi:hypothetical protein
MPAPKSPDRERFMRDLMPLKEPGNLPPTYSRLLLAKVRKPAVLARIKDPKVLRKLADDKTAGVYFNQVVKGQSIDFVVLSALEEVSREYLQTKQPLEV